ncbi:antimicrobial peptide ABC transporter ATPase [Cupriavidus basilensis OR16]|uniref:Antimicrobial peptide ABC transporter ATPase n=1 Tax=Cupriavidus basilensis OR16 TaxID=1127483 RepID=H1SH08_9BURK|nr:ABC transporter ATP-binding protein [Cupriavidus basilensis]EHP38199.1 antimicrobial peptide ABC transporter ATPase [Cupriavidus basilensis OR16]
MMTGTSEHSERSEQSGVRKASGDAVIDLRDIAFTWPAQAAPCLRLDRFRLDAGEQVFVCGPSGSGKSTLLSMLAGVLLPQQGSVRVLGTALGALSAAQRDRLRADHVGLLFQQFNLLPYLCVVDNVLLPCRFSRSRRERTAAQGETPEAAAQALLRQLDLSPALWRRPVTQLSVGQQQRVAAARALIGRPQVVLADEPTSALDAPRQQAFMALLRHECGIAGASLVFVSHDERLSAGFARRLSLPAMDAIDAIDAVDAMEPA